jgi:hypothetical protein
MEFTATFESKYHLRANTKSTCALAGTFVTKGAAGFGLELTSSSPALAQCIEPTNSNN